MQYTAALFLTFLIAGCSQQHKQQNTSQSQPSGIPYQDNVSLVRTVEKKNNGQAPNFVWYDKTGKEISFSDVAKGKPVLLNFWATWCGPCIKEMPDLVALSEEYNAKGGLVIGISVDRDSDVLTLVSDFVKAKKVQYPIVIDNGDLENAFGGLRGIPTTFYIDKEGKIVKKLVGLQSKERFAAEFDALL
jgi:thiol-disulfide isomerase/thioredoxin